ncbi:MAG: hypothetical protein HDS65_00595 [Bacteroidales bacterium]|nr:hypothetical protein [Bacteroidales bacterium]
MEKKIYETPATARITVELESGICATSVTQEQGPDHKDRHINIERQKEGQTYSQDELEWE